jgi:hypothetical protein
VETLISGNACSLLGICDDHWKKNEKDCFLPVYDRLTFFGAFAHCAKLEGVPRIERAPKELLLTVSKNATITIWTGKVYEARIDKDSKWKWLNGTDFEEWDRWKVVITDVGCRGCAFLKSRTIYLTSECFQRISYLCESDRESKLWVFTNSYRAYKYCFAWSVSNVIITLTRT